MECEGSAKTNTIRLGLSFRISCLHSFGKGGGRMGGGWGWGVAGQIASTGLRHPSFKVEEGAGKRCSECGSNPMECEGSAKTNTIRLSLSFRSSLSTFLWGGGGGAATALSPPETVIPENSGSNFNLVSSQ